MSGPPSQDLIALLYQMAVGQGKILAGITRIEAAISNQTPTQASAKAVDWKSWVEIGRLTGKVALWIAPRAVAAWAIMSGWLAAAWRWVQMLAASVW